MTKTGSVIIFTFIVLMMSCKQDETITSPLACFTSPSAVTRNQLVDFDASCSEHAEEYFWDFGDGSESTTQITQHAFKASGEYSVKLRVSKAGAKDSTTQRVIVNLNTNESSCLPSYLLGARLWPNQNYDSIVFSYQSNKSLDDAKWFYNKATIHSARMHYEYNSSGVLSKILFFTTIGINPTKENLMHTFNVRFNNLSTISRIDWMNNQGDSVRVSNFAYDEKNRLKEIKNRYILASFQHITSYEYGKDGNISRVSYLSPYSMGNEVGKPALVRVNNSFDASLPFYAATKDLRIYFENILQAEPTVNNCKSAHLYQALTSNGTPIYYGGGSLPNLEGIPLEHAIQLNDKGLIKQFSISNYTASVPTIILFQKVGYNCQ